VTEHPGEQFPPEVDPDVEPGTDPDRAEETPDYDTEPDPQGFSYDETGGAEADTEATFEESLEGHVDPAEVEFGPEFARAPGQEHEHSFVAESAEDPEQREDAGHPLVEETMGRLDELRDRPVSEHAEVYADLHERLQSALVEADAEHGDRA
jgi:hypothetical protein